MNPRAQVGELLQSVGAVLKRKNKHEVWALPNGKSFVRASTPSDVRADANSLTDLRHAIGAVPEHREGERRERKAKQIPSRPAFHGFCGTANTALADALRQTGVVESGLRQRVADLENTVNQLREGNALLKARAHACLLCRFRRWLKSLGCRFLKRRGTQDASAAEKRGMGHSDRESAI